MKNIHIIQTDKPSRLCIREFDNKLCLNTTERTYYGINQHIYITNSEEPKLKDWFISGSLVHKATDILDCDDDGKLEIHSNGYCNPLSLVEKIILTTDPSLAPDVQKIDDEFLEWFVKNPSCEEVEVRKIEDELISSKNPKIRFNALQDPPSFISAESLNNMIITYKYKIIIPKEEPKREFVNNTSKWNIEDFEEPKQETLEEFAEGYVNFQYPIAHPKRVAKKAFVNGAKWQQQRSYSEEEVLDILKTFLYNSQMGKDVEDVELWFEQFKKK